MNCPHGNPCRPSECDACSVEREARNEPHARALALALEAWQWLSGTHVMIRRGGSYSPTERVSKAETCLSSALEWEAEHGDDPIQWASDEIARS
jgi:hypothetical protein